MAANSFGDLFTLTTYGESHGAGLGAVIDGCPPQLALSSEDIQIELDRRRPGQSQYTSPRNESDRVQILSGVFEGLTTGTPIGLYIKNKDAHSQDYEQLKTVFRPGHADYVYQKKYGIRDYRGGGRASARETAMRVAAGAIAKKWLKTCHNIEIKGYISQIGSIKIDHKHFNWAEINQNPFFSPDIKAVQSFSELINSLKKKGDSIGAKVSVEAHHVPVGVGDPIYDKLDANLAKAMMSINAVKGVEIGAGFDVITQKGSQNRDSMNQNGFLTNHAGGIIGGIATGQIIKVNLAVKPPSSIPQNVDTLNIDGQNQSIRVLGRHDPCVGIRAVPVAEAMMALVIIDHMLKRFGYQ